MFILSCSKNKAPCKKTFFLLVSAMLFISSNSWATTVKTYQCPDPLKNQIEFNGSDTWGVVQGQGVPFFAKGATLKATENDKNYIDVEINIKKTTSNTEVTCTYELPDPTKTFTLSALFTGPKVTTRNFQCGVNAGWTNACSFNVEN